MEQIAQQIGAPAQPPLESTQAAPAVPATAAIEQASQPDQSSSLTLTVEDLPHTAYMVNYNFEVTWFNAQARAGLPNVFENLPPRIGDRSIFNLLLKSAQTPLSENALALVRLNLALAKERMTCEAMLQSCAGLSSERARMFETLCEEAGAVEGKLTAEVPVRLNMKADAKGGHDAPGERGGEAHIAYATYFREGILIVLAPYDGDAAELRRLLSRRDIVIRSLLSKRLPVLTELAVLVADLQESVKICSELPPDEYFELINQIWSVAGSIFRRYYGTHGKHVGDGMVYYFFPQPDSNYILNAAICAQELKAAIARLSKDWQLKKNWTNELYLNTGLNEGQEWLGTFQTATSIEFVVLGQTINHTARLSDMARFGKIWATKNFISKLPATGSHAVQFGIERVGADGQRVQVNSSYSRVCNLVDLEIGRNVKLKDISGLPVAEILGVVAQT